MLAELRQPADLAFVLAHEIAHIQLEHLNSASLRHEIAADAYALTLIERAGFSPCGVPDLVSRILAAAGRPVTVYHERTRSLSERISATCGTA
jgi:predicted Zn-dependent protease